MVAFYNTEGILLKPLQRFSSSETDDGVEGRTSEDFQNISGELRSSSTFSRGSGPHLKSVRRTTSSAGISIDASLTEPTISLDRPTNVVQNFIVAKQGNPITLGIAMRNLMYIVLWYIFSTALSFYNKTLMGKDQFNLKVPIIMTALHTGMHFVITFVMMRGFCPLIYRQSESKPLPMDRYLRRVVSVGRKRHLGAAGGAAEENGIQHTYERNELVEATHISGSRRTSIVQRAIDYYGETLIKHVFY
jgi:hypothetical protein